MKKQGFTLIELLAVIVVLAVIALISIPIIKGVIVKAKQGALKDSAYGIVEAGEMYLAKNMNEGINDTIEFTCNNGACISGSEKISYKGEFSSGKIKIYDDNKMEVCITDNKYSALKKVTDKEVQVDQGTCKYDELGYDVSALVTQTELKKKQAEIDESMTKLNDIQDTLNSALIENGVEPTDSDNDGNITVEEIVDNSINKISKEGEMIYFGATFPGTLTYTSTKTCDAKIAITNSNWNGNLTVAVRQNGKNVLTYGSMGSSTVEIKLKQNDVITYLYTAGTPSHSHMSMAIFCLN